MKKFFQDLLHWAKNIFTGLDKQGQQFLDEAITYAGYIKNLLDNPVTGTIVRLTPTTVDDAIEAKLQGYMDKIIPSLITITNFGDKTLTEKIQVFLGFVGGAMGEKGKNGIILNIASAILQLLVKEHAGKTLSNKLADTQVQARTFQLFPPPEVA